MCFRTLDSAARVCHAGLGVADATSRLVRTDTVGEIVVIRTECAGAVGTHPGAACALADGETHTAVLWVDLREGL